MLASSPDPKQTHLLHSNLLEQINPQHPLLKLAQVIPWSDFEAEFSSLYSRRGKPAKPIRLMVGLCILKHVENLSDEALVERWVQNPYYQAFCGEVVFQWRFPCDSSDLTYFRKRIGEKGFEKLFSASIACHGEAAKEAEVCIDTTVQEKNTTFPTDDKLTLKIITRCLALAKGNDIKLRRSYRQEIIDCKRALRFRMHPRNRAKVRKAIKRLKTIAGILTRELQRKLPSAVLEAEGERMALYEQVIRQKRQDKNKIYSLHEPHIYCMTKGKPHKPYEFGTKASITKTKNSNIIVGALAFAKNCYDGHTLPKVLEQMKRVSGIVAEQALVDRGYRGQKEVNGTAVLSPQPCRPNTPQKIKTYLQKQFRKRAGIEPVIGHLKAEHRLGRNYLKGFMGDQINLLMAAAGYNFRKWMRAILFWLLLFMVWYKTDREMAMQDC